VLFLGGVQLIFMGIIGEYIGRLYDEARHRPLYVVGEKLNFGMKPPTDTDIHRQFTEESRCNR
jgi:dolichol-phosphate mannosyltransferase